MADCILAMSTILQSTGLRESTSRSVNAQGIFASLPEAVREHLEGNAIRRIFAPGQLIQHRGDVMDGFWVIDKGQVKAGHYRADGEMQVLVILGRGDSFGELACLGGFARVVDVESIGATELLWISDADFSRAIAGSPDVSRELLRALSKQLQQALDNLLVLRKLPSAKRLGRILLAMSSSRTPPVALSVRHQELAELVGVTRMTISTSLTQMEELGLIERHYRKIVINEPSALRAWVLD
jgi:CRP/FNR family transcriptional regulator, cyclic AMP receptor protein